MHLESGVNSITFAGNYREKVEGKHREPLQSAITGKAYDIPGFSKHLKDFSMES